MRGGLSAAALALDPLQAAVDARLDARLDRTSSAPVALGLSGGGDSVALLHLAANWCARTGRPLLALTVDHGLHAESAGWTVRAGRMAAQAGAAWRPLAWAGPKPATGLPAAARVARHALLAEAARDAGACVVLLAHTDDDAAETEALRRGDAPGIGRLREWAPSPAWPEGRGVFLLRPLLGVGRAELRAWLRARGLAWLEDPANADLRFARARIRALGVCPSGAAAGEPPSGFGEALADGRVRLPIGRLARREPGAFRSLSAALACATGAPEAPRGRAVAALVDRLAADDPPTTSTMANLVNTASLLTATTCTLHGARVRTTAEWLEAGRELGRRPPLDLELPSGEPQVWDGRFEACTVEAGWRVGAAAGRLSRLTQRERAELRTLPPHVRGAHPVFVRDGEVRLRPDGASLRALAPTRFDAAVGRIGREADLAARTGRGVRG